MAFIDLAISDSGGIELMRKIRGISPDTKRMVMTGHLESHPLVQLAMSEKPDGLLFKPFDIESLLALI